jgi:O-antigen ligase
MAMLVYQTSERTAIYMQAQNDYLQLVAEGGVLVSVAALVVVLVILTRIVRRFRDGDSDSLRYWARAGAVAGLAGIATQSVVEYSLQRPGNTAVLVVLLALAMHRSLPRTGAHANRL